MNAPGRGVLLVALALAACRRPHAPSPTASPTPAPTVALPAPPVAPAPPPAPTPAPSPTPARPAPQPWCVLSVPQASARAVDRRGHILALTGTTLRDETAGGAPVVLPRAERCAATHDALTFARDGSAAAVAHGRLYLRPTASAPWSATPVCTDLDGEPWTSRGPGRGWAVVARRIPAGDTALLLTDEPAARAGWYAVRALDTALTATLLDPDGSLVSLVAGGHLVVVDHTRIVAGEVIAGQGATFDSLTRTGAGIAAARDDGDDARDVVVGTSVQAPFERQHLARPAGPHTRRVFVSDFGRLIATTDRGVEWSAGHGQPFTEVARWPASAAASSASAEGDPGTHATVGWLDDGSPVVVAPSVLVSPSCAGLPEVSRLGEQSVHR